MRWIVLLLASLSALGLRAQSDTYFALPPLYEWAGGQHDVALYISTSAPSANVWIYNSDTSVNNNLVVTSGAIATVTYSAIIPALQSTYGARELGWSNSKRYKDALFVESNVPVTVTQRIIHQNNQEIITGKGRNALGTHFYLASQTEIEQTVSGNFSSYLGMHYISVVALEDSTEVRFRARAGNLFDNAQDSVVFTLNQGQSWVSTMRDNYKLIGTEVIASKPIAVTAGGNHLKNSSAVNGDAGIDQITPVDHLGTKHVVLRGMNYFPQDYFMVVATQPGTQVSVDGTSIMTNTGPGDWYTYKMPGQATNPGKPFIVESNLPVYVYQVTTGTLNYQPEQGMAQLPHVECTGSTYIRYNKPSGLSTSALITIPTAAVNALNYNGSPAMGNASITSQQSTYDTAWSGIFIPASALTNNFVLDCTTPFHVGILGGLSSATGAYGYISGFDDDLKLLDPISAQPVTNVPLGNVCATPIPLNFDYISCADSATVIRSELLQGLGSVVDSNARDTQLHALIDPQYTGPVSIKIVVEDDDGRLDSLTYTFTYYGTQFDPIAVDTAAVCSSQPVVLEVDQAGLSYLWSNGDTTQSATFNSAGWAWVSVDLGLCQFTDSVFLIDGSSYAPPYSDTAFCDSVVWDFSHPQLDSLYWPSWDTSTMKMTFYESGTYEFSATDINGCTATHEVHVRIIPKPYVDQGFSCPEYKLVASGYTTFIALELGGNRYTEPELDTLFTFAGTHEIKLVAIDSCGNQDTIYSILEVDCLDDLLLWVPNSFSPNNDGVNDAFCLSTSLPERTTYQVFDRWGNQLFEGRADECWDPVALGQNLTSGAYALKVFTRLPSEKLHLERHTIHLLR